MEMYNEEEVLSLLKSKDEGQNKKAFGRLVSFYSEKLYWQIRKMVLSHDDANDLLQNTFIKAWTSIHLFRGEAKLSTWLYKIAINESITFLNRQRSMNNISLDDSDVFLLDRLQSSDYFDGDALQIKFQKALLLLPAKQRLVFNMRYFDEMPYEKIADISGTSIGALKASYHHAMKKIRAFILEED
ncbi:RNA polymerase sigma E factor [Bacteroidales bacterium]|nr:RNA polymerase sigma E factor [Bacteroidales bacterium]